MTNAGICPASWCTIHRERISKNLELALGLVPAGRRFCAVLKADAYGHGISQVVPLVQEQGVTCIGITSNAEARAVRDARFGGTLIRLRTATPQEIDGALGDRVEEQVASISTARLIRAYMDTNRYRDRVHLSLNASGMSRDALEVSTGPGQDTCRQILGVLGKNIGGICTHLPSNEPHELTQSSELFQQQVSWVLENSDLSRKDVLVHAGSSLTLVSGVDVDTDMYRCGAILYGILKPEHGFRSTMDLGARVVSLQEYPKGSSVGYDRASHLDQDRRLACISIGYENGFRRIAHGKCAVSIGNALAPVVGKISMNAIVADVTNIASVQVGDKVSVFGDVDGARISPQMAEAQFQTILADLFTDWGLRNHRVYR
ncbi:alanine racemase C-terminal domain-containing protein [Phaeobacter sp. NW0010-22]|uniref:alanine racemase n=1 Tax=Phaeobacter sp. NW0010-22 TaxID=3135907 RepID=UPI0031020C3C